MILRARIRRAYPLALTLLALLVPAAPAQGRPPREMDRYVERARETFEVPGLALAIVKDGKVVVARGYGVRRLGDPSPVDAATLFGIASNTKAFTATALAMLVEEGKLEWDAPVTRYLPGFHLSNPYVTRELTVRDLLVHRSGLSLGAGDLLWWPASNLSREEIVRRVGYIPLSTSFRSTYAYDNVLYVVAGRLLEAVSRRSWEYFVKARILDPIGMAHTTPRINEGLASPNVARPHAHVEGTLREIPPYTGENAAPAAGIYSSAEDMAKWMIVQMDSGRVGSGPRVFSPQTAEQLWSLVVPTPIGNPSRELAQTRPNFAGYGLGFTVRDYRGRKVVGHTGGLPGYLSEVVMVPSLKLGIAVLTNQESGGAFRSITYRVLDHYLGAPDTDWIRAYRTVAARSDSSYDAAERKVVAARNPTAPHSLPLSAYAGRYRDPWYGEVTIVEEGGRLVMRFAHTPWLVGPLEHWHHDTFVARWTDRAVRADAFVTFALNPDGSIERARMEPMSPRTDFSFDFQDLDLRPARPAR